jgi:DNA uptake protein ComE-like DNA-binding protein
MNGKPKNEPKIDEEVEETFPASDPPSYMGSTAVAGAPKEKGAGSNGADGAAQPVEQDRVSCNLNTASEEELGSLPALGPDHVRALLDARPFQSWEDLKELAGFEGKTIAALKHGGAYIGWESAGPQ